jgi:hypothetical protein
MKMSFFIAPLLVCTAGFAGAQNVQVQAFHSVEGMPMKLNQAALAGRSPRAVTTPKSSVVFIGDTVIPHVVDGGSWLTTFMFVNLENHQVHLNLYFFNDDGTDLILPIEGQGNVRGMSLTMGPACTLQFQTMDTSSTTRTGWAYMSQDNYNDSIGGMAVFRQVIPGRPDFEAVVPVVSQFQNHFVMYYDNVGFTTAYAVANPSSQTVTIPLTVRNQAGVVLQSTSATLCPYCHSADTLVNLLPATAGGRGTVEIQTSGYGVAALGLRFGAASFTSFPTMENFNWFVSQ